MQKLFALLIVLSLLSFTAKEDSYSVNTKDSSVQWLGKKTTGQHGGEVPIQSGSLKVVNDAPWSGEFVLNMTGMTDTDIKDADDNKHLMEHLKGEDFFGVEKFPTASLVIKKFEKMEKPGADGTNYTATADLTIKGVKNEIQFPAQINIKGDAIKANANITIDRTKWNITYKSKTILGSMADKFIYDDVVFTVKLSLNKTK